MFRLTPDQIKKGYPPTLIIIRTEMINHENEFSFLNVNDNG
jgi:hypothetical protein